MFAEKCYRWMFLFEPQSSAVHIPYGTPCQILGTIFREVQVQTLLHVDRRSVFNIIRNFLQNQMTGESEELQLVFFLLDIINELCQTPFDQFCWKNFSSVLCWCILFVHFSKLTSPSCCMSESADSKASVPVAYRVVCLDTHKFRELTYLSDVKPQLRRTMFLNLRSVDPKGICEKKIWASKCK